MSRLDKLTDEKIAKALGHLGYAAGWLSADVICGGNTQNETAIKAIEAAVAILEGTDEQEPTDGTDTHTPQAAETPNPQTA